MEQDGVIHPGTPPIMVLDTAPGTAVIIIIPWHTIHGIMIPGMDLPITVLALDMPFIPDTIPIIFTTTEVMNTGNQVLTTGGFQEVLITIL